MSDRQWLLLQGPAHGRVVRVRGGNVRTAVSVHLAGSGPALYIACAFAHNKKVYQVALCAEAGTRGLPEDHEVCRLIESTNIQPFEVLQ